MKINRLRKADLERAKPGKPLCDGGGLWFRPSAAKDGSVNRSWFYKAFDPERRTDAVLGLGPYPLVGLEDARAAARGLDLRRRNGENVFKTRREEKLAQRTEKAAEAQAKSVKPALIFDRALDLCIENTKAKWTSDKHARQFKESLLKHAAVLGPMAVADITIEHIIAVLRPLWRTHPETASRVRGRLQRVLDTGYSDLHRDHPLAAQELIDRNPARLTSHLKFLLGEHDRSATPFEAMPFAQVATFVKDLRADGSIAAFALEFCLLTASRNDTVTNALWSEVDLEQRVWCIPAERMKNRKGGDHEVPLSSRCIAILRQMAEIRSGDRVFDISRTAMWNLMKRLHPTLHIHGLRSTFRDWCGDIEGADVELAELALHHAVGNKVTRAYRRGKALERRRTLMERWAAFCEASYESNVVQLPPAEVA
jgi:integrase